jgi:hypothetical protein
MTMQTAIILQRPRVLQSDVGICAYDSLLQIVAEWHEEIQGAAIPDATTKEVRWHASEAR